MYRQVGLITGIAGVAIGAAYIGGGAVVGYGVGAGGGAAAGIAGGGILGGAKGLVDRRRFRAYENPQVD